MTAPSSMLRLFVAVELPDDVKAALASTVSALRRAAIDDGVRWVKPEGIHITLKFLGGIAEDRLPAMHTALRIAVRDAAPFAIRTSALGSFGGRGSLRVIWVGIAGETDALADLASRVDVALTPLGFERETRPFAAHLTLARIRDDASRQVRERIYDLIAAAPPAELCALRVDRVSLMRSTLGRGGATYDAVGSYPLEGAAP